MTTVLRRRGLNTFVASVVLVFAFGLLVSALANVSHPGGAVALAALGLPFLYTGFRFLRMRVLLTDDGLQVHNFWRTSRIPWTDVAEVLPAVLDVAADPTRSVIQRGRAILEAGRRARADSASREQLAVWMRGGSFQAKKWVGPVSLAWAAACALGCAVGQGGDRSQIADALASWPPLEAGKLFHWAQSESWFDGITDSNGTAP